MTKPHVSKAKRTRHDRAGGHSAHDAPGGGGGGGEGDGDLGGVEGRVVQVAQGAEGHLGVAALQHERGHHEHQGQEEQGQNPLLQQGEQGGETHGSTKRD